MTDTSDDYKSYISGVFSRASESYEAVGLDFFTSFGRLLVDYASIPPGARVLDVACGRGAVLFPAAEAAGSSGEAVGIDLSAQMVERTAADVAAAGLNNVTVRRMDAENLTFAANSFDVVLCGFGLFFLPNLPRAMAGFRRVLKPNGVLAATTFEKVPSAGEERYEALNRSFAPRLHPGPSTTVQELDEEDKLRQAFTSNGFEAIEIARRQKQVKFRDDEERWRWWWSHGFRGFLERMDEETLADYKQQAFVLIQELAEKDDADMWHILLTRARKP